MGFGFPTNKTLPPVTYCNLTPNSGLSRYYCFSTHNRWMKKQLNYLNCWPTVSLLLSTDRVNATITRWRTTPTEQTLFTALDSHCCTHVQTTSPPVSQTIVVNRHVEFFFKWHRIRAVFFAIAELLVLKRHTACKVRFVFSANDRLM